MADKPKITGISFNLFAIIAVLILLPLATSTITSFSTANSSEYISVNKKVEPDEGYFPDGTTKPFADRKMFTWTDKGNNMTNEYLQSNPQSTVDNYQTVWDFSNYQNFVDCYNNWLLFCDQGLYGGLGGGVDYRFARNNDVFFQSSDNHNSLASLSIPNYNGYIGYSGNEFAWQVHKNYMQYIPNSSDISKLKFTFIDYNNAYSCDTPIFQTILFKHDITFRLNSDKDTDYTLSNFESSKSSKYEVSYLPNGQTTTYLNGTSQPFGNICHVQFELEYEFSPFEIIEISERFDRNFENMDLFLRVYDIKAQYTDDLLIEGGLTYGNGQFAGVVYPLAFEGDNKHGLLFEYTEVDTAKTNFFLSGGTLILGIALFLLSIASTQYWNPVIEFFKPDGV